MIYKYIGFILTPLTVNKTVCLYFYHPGGAPWFSWFFAFFLVVFLVHFYAFLRAFSGAVLPCCLSCFFWCLSVILLVVFLCFSWCFSTVFWCFFRAFFRACPFSFLCMFPLGGGPVFCRAFFGAFSVLFSVLFFVPFIMFFFVFFFVHFFVFSRAFFRALGGTQDKQPQYFAFWPVFFLVFFLVVTTSEDRIYTINICIYIWYIYIFISYIIHHISHFFLACLHILLHIFISKLIEKTQKTHIPIFTKEPTAPPPNRSKPLHLRVCDTCDGTGAKPGAGAARHVTVRREGMVREDDPFIHSWLLHQKIFSQWKDSWI